MSGAFLSGNRPRMSFDVNATERNRMHYNTNDMKYVIFEMRIIRYPPALLDERRFLRPFGLVDIEESCDLRLLRYFSGIWGGFVAAL